MTSGHSATHHLHLRSAGDKQSRARQFYEWLESRPIGASMEADAIRADLIEAMEKHPHLFSDDRIIDGQGGEPSVDEGVLNALADMIIAEYAVDDFEHSHPHIPHTPGAHLSPEEEERVLEYKDLLEKLAGARERFLESVGHDQHLSESHTLDHSLGLETAASNSTPLGGSSGSWEESN